MPKLSQICEELRALKGHKHTYPNSFIIMGDKPQNCHLRQFAAHNSSSQTACENVKTQCDLQNAHPIVYLDTLYYHDCAAKLGYSFQSEGEVCWVIPLLVVENRDVLGILL